MVLTRRGAGRANRARRSLKINSIRNSTMMSGINNIETTQTEDMLAQLKIHVMENKKALERDNEKFEKFQNELDLQRKSLAGITKTLVESEKAINDRLNHQSAWMESLAQNVSEVNKTARIVGKHIAEQTELNSYYENSIKVVNANQEKLVDRLNRQTIMNNGGGNGFAPIRYAAPCFRGKSGERPMKFLKEFERYVDSMPHIDIKILISQCLKDEAYEWWCMVEHDVIDICSFSVEFSLRYWNKDKQYKIRRQLETGYYYPNEKTTRSEYAIKMYNDAIDLSKQISESEIVESLSRHFDEKVHLACEVEHVCDMHGLLKILDRTEMRGQLNNPYFNRNVFKNNNQNKELHEEMNVKPQESKQNVQRSVNQSKSNQNSGEVQQNKNFGQKKNWNDQPRNRSVNQIEFENEETGNAISLCLEPREQ